MSDDLRLDKTAELLKVLTNPTRLRIIQLLSLHGELNASKIVSELKREQALVSHHLIKMSDFGMLLSRHQGKEVWYTLADPALSEMVRLMLR